MGKIVIKNEAGKSYELAFNRSAIVRMEKAGFKAENIEKEPLSTVVLLMRGAFYKNYPQLADEEIDAICDEIEMDEAFIKAVMELYAEAVLSLNGQNKNTSKNFKWEKN